jgi:glutaredoxin 3
MLAWLQNIHKDSPIKSQRITMTANIIIYSSSHCAYCDRAKALLTRKGQRFTEIFVDNDDQQRENMIAKTNRYTVPQIFINEQHVGGCDDLYALDRSGKLDELLK